MRKSIILMISTLVMFAFPVGLMAGEMTRDSGQMDMNSPGQGMNMDMGLKGNMIHSGVVEGYRLTYQLFKMKPADPDTGATNHLMVNLVDSNGAPVRDATVGYLIKGPDGTEQKLMCMGMGGGYGSNLNMAATGDYEIKTKVLTNGKKLIDSFTYTVK